MVSWAPHSAQTYKRGIANGCRIGTTFCSFIPSLARHSKQSRAAGGKTSVMTYEC